jgi:hypothetical protein
VLKDLRLQFDKLANPTSEQKRQYNEEVQRVQSIAKADPHDVYSEIGEQLGKLMDAYDAIGKLFIKEETSAKQVYKGEESIGRRALKRILIRARLDGMLAEIREMMVYQAPAELGSLWSKFELMWQQIVAEQEAAHAEELRQVQIATWRRKKKVEELKAQAAWISAVAFILLWTLGLLWLTNKSMNLYLGLS